METEAPALDQKTEILNRIIHFIEGLGISVIAEALPDNTFLPGLRLGPNCIYADFSRLYPGDLLHEAGHLAVTTSEERAVAGTKHMASGWPSDGEEIGAILWSYAALTYLGIPEDVVFHANGYKNDSEWLIENFKRGEYIGLPFLEWTGIALGKERAARENRPAFPVVIKWLRD